MHIFLADRQPYFSQHLAALKNKPVMKYDRSRLKEKITTFTLQTATPLSDLDAAPLFDYRIFPEHVLTALTEWQQEGREMRVGDTIVQQVHLPPLRRFSFKLVFGVRICAVIDEPNRIGFSYETLEGHAERGISTFTLEQEGGIAVFRIHTFSEPGNRWLKMLSFLTVPYQRYCTKAAGKHLVRRLHR